MNRHERIEFNVRTCMSDGPGINSADEYIERAAELGHKAIAITDLNSVQSFPDAMKAGKKHGIKIIYGVEMEVIDIERMETEDSLDKYGYNTTKLIYPKILPESYYMTIYVKNQNGLSSLYKLISEAYIELFYEKPRIKKSSLEKYREDLLICLGSHSNELTQAIINGDDEEKILKIANFYDFLIINDSYTNEDYINACGKVRELGDKLNKPVLIVGNVTYLDSLDKQSNQIAIETDLKKDYYEFYNPEKATIKNTCKLSKEEYGGDYKDTEEMLERYSFLGEDKAEELVVKNPNLICSLIEEIKIFPDIDYITEIDESGSKLRDFAYDSLREIYGDPLPTIVEKYIEFELNLIAKNEWSNKFLIGMEIAKSNKLKGYPVIADETFSSWLLGKLCGLTEISSLPPHYICSHCKHSEFISDNKYIFGYDLPNKQCPVCGTQLKKDGYRVPLPIMSGVSGVAEPKLKIKVANEQMATTIEDLNSFITENLGTNHMIRDGKIEKFNYFAFFNNLSKDDINKLGIEDNNIQHKLGEKKTGRILSGDFFSKGDLSLVPKNMEIYDYMPIEKSINDYGLFIGHMDYRIDYINFNLDGDGILTMLKKLEQSTNISIDNIDLSDPLALSLFKSADALNMDTKVFNNNNGLLGISSFSDRRLGWISKVNWNKKILAEVKINSFLDLIRALAATIDGKDEDELMDIIKVNDGDLSSAIIMSEDIYLYLVSKGIDEKYASDTMWDLMGKYFKNKRMNRRDDEKKEKLLDDERKEKLKEYGISDEYISKFNNFVPTDFIEQYAFEIINYVRLAWYKLYYPLEFYSAALNYYNSLIDVYPIVGEISQLREQLALDLAFYDQEKVEYTKILYELTLEMRARGYQFSSKPYVDRFVIEDGKIRMFG